MKKQGSGLFLCLWQQATECENYYLLPRLKINSKLHQITELDIGNLFGILHMATKAVDTFKSSEFRLQAVAARTYDP